MPPSCMPPSCDQLQDGRPRGSVMLQVLVVPFSVMTSVAVLVSLAPPAG